MFWLRRRRPNSGSSFKLLRQELTKANHGMTVSPNSWSSDPMAQTLILKDRSQECRLTMIQRSRMIKRIKVRRKVKLKIKMEKLKMNKKRMVKLSKMYSLMKIHASM